MGTVRPSPGLSTDVDSVCRVRTTASCTDHGFLSQVGNACNQGLLPYRDPLPRLANCSLLPAVENITWVSRLLHLQWSVPPTGSQHRPLDPSFSVCLSVVSSFPLPQFGPVQNCAGLGTHLNHCQVPVTKIPGRNNLKEERSALVPGSRRFQPTATAECDGGASHHSGPGNSTNWQRRSSFQCPLLLSYFYWLGPSS